MDRRFATFLSAVFLLSLASLCYEVSLSYEFGFMFWTNLSYMIVSVAMFGLGAGAIGGYFLSKKLKDRYFELLQIGSLLFSVFILVSLFLVSEASRTKYFEEIDINRMNLFSRESSLFFFGFCFVPAMPFFFSGICLSSALNYPSERRNISYIYFSDLLGAGIGSFIITYLVPFTNVEGVIIFCSAMALLASLFFRMPGKKMTLLFILLVLLVSSSFTYRDTFQPTPKKPLATYVRSGAEVLYTRWSPTSRVDVLKFSQGKIQFLVNGSYPVTVYTGGHGIDREEYDPRYFMFHGRPSSVLLLGSGGGVEIAMASQKDASRIIAVEINPVIVDMMLHEFRDISGDIYQRKNVYPVIEDGRTYVNGSEEKFDLIENGVLGADALILPSSFVQTFSDTYVYTVEANMDYFNHLSEEGKAVILVTSLLDGYNAIDAERGVSYRLLRQYFTTYEALKKSGVDPDKHIMIFRHVMGSGYQKVNRQTDYTFIFKRELSEEEVKYMLSKAQEFQDRMRRHYEETKNPEADVFRFECIHAPYFSTSIDFHSYLGRLPEGRDVSPTTDDHPYFYHTSCGAPGFLSKMLYAFLFFVLVFFLAPVMIERRMEFKSPATLRLLPYFLCLGIGYVLVQAVLIQRLTLFLGQPAYAFQVVLFSMLFFSGIGSLLTGRYMKDERKTVTVLLVLVVLLSLYVVSISPFIYKFMPYTIEKKVLASVFYLAPLSLFLGMPFPLGLRIASQHAKTDVIWMYAINGGGSVLGSIVGMMIAFSAGFMYSFITGAIIYAFAFIFGLWALHR